MEDKGKKLTRSQVSKRQFRDNWYRRYDWTYQRRPMFTSFRQSGSQEPIYSWAPLRFWLQSREYYTLCKGQQSFSVGVAGGKSFSCPKAARLNIEVTIENRNNSSITFNELANKMHSFHRKSDVLFVLMLTIIECSPLWFGITVLYGNYCSSFSTFLSATYKFRTIWRVHVTLRKPRPPLWHFV